MPRTLLRLVVMILVGLVAPVATPLAGAQEDPYGGTTTTVQLPRSDVECDLSVTSARAGSSVTATVRNVAPGVVVRVRFGGQEVGRAEAESDAVTSVQIEFRVPPVSPGRYLVTAVGADFTARCGADTDGYFAVLAAQTDRGDDRSLPRTGVYVALLVAMAAALLLVGRAVLESARRRRLRIERAMRDEAKHLARSGRPPT